MRKLLWDITNKCNLSCKHCYNDSTNSKKDYKLSDIEIQHIFNNINDLNIKKIVFLGGEPTISKNIIKVLEFSNLYGINTSITTNGQYISKEVENCIINGMLDTMIFSVDGISPKTNDIIRGKGSFDKVIYNIKYYNMLKNKYNLKLKIYFSICFNGVNYKDAKYLISFVKNLKIDGLLISKIDMEGNANRNKDILNIDLEDYLDCIEFIAEEYSKLNSEENFYLEIVIKKILNNFLKQKYKLSNFYENKGKSICNGVNEEFYIDDEYNIYPCRVCKYNKKNYNFLNKPMNIKSNSTNDIFNSKDIKDFYEYTRDLKNYKISKFCLKCEFFKDCKPCPLSKEFVPDECISINIRKNRNKYKLLNKKLELNKKLFVNLLNENTVELYDIQSEFSYEFDKSDYDNLKFFIDSDSIYTGIKKAYNYKKNNEKFHEFKLESIDFVEELFDLKILVETQ